MNKPDSSVPRAALAAVLVVAAGATGFVVHRHLTGNTAPAPLTAQPSTASGAPEPTDTSAPATEPAGRRIPDILPEITLANEEGAPTALSSFAGRPLLINFWATWCAPCRREIPLLNRIRSERQSENVEIVGIAVDFRDKVLEYTKNTRIDYPLLIGEEDGLAATEALGVGMGFPSSVFVDSQNRILTVKIGEIHEDEINFAFDRLRDIDKGILTREAAQKAVNDAFREFATKRALSEKTPPDPAS